MTDFRNPVISYHISKTLLKKKKELLVEMKGFKFQKLMKKAFHWEFENHGATYSPPIYETVFNDSGINDTLNSSNELILSRFQNGSVKVLAG